MKKLKKIISFCLILVFTLPVFFIKGTTKDKAFAAAPTNLYASISVSGQVLDETTLQVIDDVTYVVTNSAATVTFQYLAYNYKVELSNPSNFHATTLDIVLEKDAESGLFPTTFAVNETIYQYDIVEGAIVIYNTSGPIIAGTIPVLHSNNGDLLSYTETETTRTISIIKSYTLDESSPTSTISYTVYRHETEVSGAVNENDPIVIQFERPVINFNSDDAISFECVGLDVGASPFVDTKIPREHSFANVKLSFTNNDYTEVNPLYFDINHNGFIYTYKLYSKNINSKDLLFVEYYDEQRPKNNKSLATELFANGEIKTAVYKYVGATENFNEFLINFNKTGRYEVSVYDSTYVLGLKNNNFYSTSFYIKNESAENTAFENVYVIFQTLEDEGTPIDYVVSESTLNNDVQVTIKNLPFYFEKDTILEDEDIVLDYTVTTFGGSSNIPTTTYYTKTQLEEMLNEDGDLVMVVKEDAFYELRLSQYHIEDGVRVKGGSIYHPSTGELIKSYEQYYNFSVVKAPKTSFTKYKVNDEYEVEYDANGNPKTTTKEAEIPYRVIRDYDNYRNIKSKLNMLFEFKTDTVARTEVTLDKAYINNYYIDYAMQEVKVEEFDVLNEDKKVIDQLNLRFSGIGEIVVNITFNGKTTTEVLNEETGFTLTFHEYGVYKVSFTDEMGTLGTGEFNYEKPPNTSSTLLFVFAGILVGGVVLFILVARGKMKTR